MRQLLALDLTTPAATTLALLRLREAPASIRIVAFTGSGKGGVGHRPWQGPTGVTALFGLYPSMTLASALAYTQSLPSGSIDIAVPVIYAMDNNLPIDLFSLYLSRDPLPGPMAPADALAAYSAKLGIKAELEVHHLVQV